jgi:hypothetical protein
VLELDLLFVLRFTVLGTVFVWKGSELLVAAVDHLGERYGIPPVVQGAVVAAAGSSCPEFASTVVPSLDTGPSNWDAVPSSAPASTTSSSFPRSRRRAGREPCRRTATSSTRRPGST